MVSELDTPLIATTPQIDKLEIIDEENQLETSPMSPTSQISSDLLCRICFEEEEMTTLPCSHQICKKCVPRLKKEECPFCRAKFIRKKRMVKNPPNEENNEENNGDYSSGLVLHFLGWAFCLSILTYTIYSY